VTNRHSVKAAVSALSAALTLGALAEAMPVKKYLAFGWDTENVRPAELLRGAKDFRALGLDGVGLCIRKSLPDGRMLNSHTVFDGTTRWTREDLADQADVFGEIARTDGMRESMIEFLFNTKNRIAWDDDARWAVVANNLRVLAEFAKETGIRGFCLDNEDYFQNKQYDWNKQEDPPYEEARKLARQRGRELFGPVFQAHPGIVIQFYFMFNEIWDIHKTADPRTVCSATKCLRAAFFDGMYDVMPPRATIIDGTEMTYTSTPSNDAFRAYAAINTAGSLPLVSPENRAKYLAQTSRAYAMYMDAYVMTNTKSCWYMPPMKNGSRLQRFEQNLVEANRWAYDYVWFWGERHNYADYGKTLDEHYVIGFENKNGAGSRQTWQTMLPGLADMMRSVKDPYGYVGEKLAAQQAAGTFRNLVDESKYKTVKLGDRTVIEISSNSVDAVVWDVKPGQWYGAVVRVSNGNFSGYANWRDAAGKWTNRNFGYVAYWDFRGPDKDGWYEGRILARVPEDVRSFVTIIWANNRKPGESAYAEGFKVFKLR